MTRNVAVIAVVAVVCAGLGFAAFEYVRDPVLRNVSCTLEQHGTGATVSGDIYNPSMVSRSFAVRPTFWLADGTQVAESMHLYVSVPGHANDD